MPRAIAMRVFRSLLILLIVIAALTFRLQADAQTTGEAEVFLETAGAPSVAAGTPLTLAVVVEGLHHQGSIGYDDDRDTRPDRWEPSLGLGAFEFEITFDPRMLWVAEAELGSIQESSDRGFQCFQGRDAPEHFAFGCVSLGAEPPGPEGNLELARVTIVPIGSGPTTLELEALLAGPLADDIPVKVVKTVTLTVQSAAGAAGKTPNAGGGNDPATEATPRFTDWPFVLTDEPPGPDPEDDATPEDPTVLGEAPDSGSDRPAQSGGVLSGSLALWSAAAGGGVAAAGALAVAVVRWRRRERP